MVSLTERRQAVKYISNNYKISERKSCKIININRKSLRYKSKRKGDKELILRAHELSRKHRRYGYRKIHKLLSREGIKTSQERVRIIRLKEGLKVPKKARKKRNLGNKQNALLKANYPNHVWSYDFIFDQTVSGYTIKFLVIIDEFTKQCLQIVAAKRIDSKRIIKELQKLFFLNGKPVFIRSDNGPEFIANRLKEYIKQSHLDTLFIEPGSPWQNPYVESFNDKFRDECLNANLFFTFKEAQCIADNYREEHNDFRPHATLNYLTPTEFLNSYQLNKKIA